MNNKTNIICKNCNKQFNSISSLKVHKREKYTYINTVIINCKSCLEDFHSVNFNKRLNKIYDKCEECRDLQKILCTNDLIHNTFVYGNNNKRFFIDHGEAIPMCSVYLCNNKLPCEKHPINKIVKCNGTKCNNCFIKNDKNQCELCISKNNKSKNKLRNKIKIFKQELGGKCIDCGFNELFFLEFDHINPSKKTIQITRSSPTKWENEKDNLQLRCGRCHRIKSQHVDISDELCKNKKFKKYNKDIVKNIKKNIGCCQICKWSVEDKDKMCCALDFDHIFNKNKQISNMYSFNKFKIIQEIMKTRLICRHCHELYTCLQRGGKSLKFYYSDIEIQKFKDILYDKNIILNCINQISNTLQTLNLKLT